MLSTRAVQTLFLAVTLLFAGTLGWLGWRLIQQDRALARQRRLEQLDAAADRVSAAIYRRLAELEEALADPEHGRIPPGLVLVRARRDGVNVRPAGGLLYLPVLPSVAELPPSTFTDGEALEFQNNNPAAAAEAFRRLTRSGDSRIRAGVRPCLDAGQQEDHLRGRGWLRAFKAGRTAGDRKGRRNARVDSAGCHGHIDGSRLAPVLPHLLAGL